MTPTLKIKRNVIDEKYEEAIDEICGASKPVLTAAAKGWSAVSTNQVKRVAVLFFSKVPRPVGKAVRECSIDSTSSRRPAGNAVKFDLGGTELANVQMAADRRAVFTVSLAVLKFQQVSRRGQSSFLQKVAMSDCVRDTISETHDTFVQRPKIQKARYSRYNKNKSVMAECFQNCNNERISRVSCKPNRSLARCY